MDFDFYRSTITFLCVWLLSIALISAATLIISSFYFLWAHYFVHSFLAWGWDIYRQENIIDCESILSTLRTHNWKGRFYKWGWGKGAASWLKDEWMVEKHAQVLVLVHAHITVAMTVSNAGEWRLWQVHTLVWSLVHFFQRHSLSIKKICLWNVLSNC